MRSYNFKENPDLVDKITEELSQDERLKEFFIEHDVSAEAIENALPDLLTFQSEFTHCEECKSLSECKQVTTGMQPQLTMVRGKIVLEYHPCDYLRAYREEKAVKDRMRSLYMPKMIQKATLEDFRMDSETRTKLYQQIVALTNRFHRGETIKGLYLHGRYQVGKTYTLGAIANRFSELGHVVLIAYYPDLVRELKSSIKTGTLESRIDELKTVDILLFDDIGGEAFSAWVRDEILGPVLQHRLLDEKPTFFSSNAPLKELYKYYIENDQQNELIKAYRIIERIENLSDAFNM